MTEQTSAPEDKLDLKKVLPIFVVVLIDLMGLTIIIPLLPLYAASFQASALVIGLLGAAYPAMQFIGAPLLGRLSDRYGRKPVLVVSQIGTMIGFILLGFANSLPFLFAARLIDGLTGGNISVAQAAITDSTNEKTRTQGLGLIGAAFGLGFIIGPIVAFVSLSLSNNNFAVPAFVAAGFSLLAILLTAFWFPETLTEERRAAITARAGKNSAFSFRAMIDALRRPEVGLLLILIAAQQIAFGGFEQFLSLFTLNRLGLDASGNSALFVYVGVLIVAVQGYFVGRWSKKLGDRTVVLIGLATLSAGLILTAVTPRHAYPWYDEAALRAEMTSGEMRAHETPPTENLTIPIPPQESAGWSGLIWIMVAMIPASIGGGVLQPTINSLITKRVGPDEIGGMLGISSAFLSGANAIAPIFMGALFQGFGSYAPFLVGGVILAILLVLAFRMIEPESAEERAAGLARGGAAH